MMDFLLLLSRQGKLRLARWYAPYSLSERAQIVRDATSLVAVPRQGRASAALSSFADYRGGRLVFRRYASLYFVAGAPASTNELLVLEAIHRLVETLDRHFGNVCELDLIFGFARAHHVLDEFVAAGEVMEPSMRAVLRCVQAADDAEAEERAEDRRVW